MVSRDDDNRLIALDYLELLVEVKPEKLEPAAVRWHGRLEVEAAMTLAESQLAPALASLRRGTLRCRPAPPAASPGQADADRTTALRFHAGGFRCRTSRSGGCRSRGRE